MTTLTLVRPEAVVFSPESVADELESAVRGAVELYRPEDTPQGAFVKLVQVHLMKYHSMMDEKRLPDFSGYTHFRFRNYDDDLVRLAVLLSILTDIAATISAKPYDSSEKHLRLAIDRALRLARNQVPHIKTEPSGAPIHQRAPLFSIKFLRTENLLKGF